MPEIGQKECRKRSEKGKERSPERGKAAAASGSRSWKTPSPSQLRGELRSAKAKCSVCQAGTGPETWVEQGWHQKPVWTSLVQKGRGDRAMKESHSQLYLKETLSW